MTPLSIQGSKLFITERMLQRIASEPWRWSRDALSLKDGIQFIAEHAISRGALGIILPTYQLSNQSVFRQDEDENRLTVLSQLHPDFQKRIELADPRRNCALHTAAIIKPIWDELDERSANPPENWLRGEEYIFLRHLPNHIFSLLVGIEKSCEVFASMIEIRVALRALKRCIESEEGRAHVSNLCGLFSTYKPATIEALCVKSTANKDLMQLFLDFAEDEAYQMVSKYTFRIGFPRRMKRATTILKRCIRRLLDKPLFRSSVDLTTQALELATGIPTPTCEQLELLLKKSYLPPVNDEFVFGSSMISNMSRK